MSSYTITIAPNDGSGNTTTMLVDTSGDGVRITDVHLHAGDGLSNGRLPVVDFGLLLQAIQPGRAAIAEPTTAAPTPSPTKTTPRRRGSPSPAAESTVAKPYRAERSKSSAGAPTKASSTARAAAKQTSTRTRKKVEPAKPTSGTRAYRKMPDDIRQVLGQAGTAGAVADHYGVPRHTANGWVRRVRQEDVSG